MITAHAHIPANLTDVDGHLPMLKSTLRREIATAMWTDADKHQFPKGFDPDVDVSLVCTPVARMHDDMTAVVMLTIVAPATPDLLDQKFLQKRLKDMRDNVLARGDCKWLERYRRQLIVGPIPVWQKSISIDYLPRPIGGHSCG